jgi:hypothetical protein
MGQMRDLGFDSAEAVAIVRHEAEIAALPRFLIGLPVFWAIWQERAA